MNDRLVLRVPKVLHLLQSFARNANLHHGYIRWGVARDGIEVEQKRKGRRTDEPGHFESHY